MSATLAPPFDVVAFDLDGTLADTSADLAAALNHALQRAGRPAIMLDDVRSMVGHGTRALMRKGLAATGAASEALVEASLPDLVDFYASNICRATAAYPGVETALDTLSSRGARLAICTNKPERLTRMLLDALGWARRFDAVIGGDTLPVCKPDPAPLREAIARAGGGAAAYVGDSITDARTAAAAGVPFIAVAFGFRDRPVEQLGGQAVLDHFDALTATLERLAEAPDPARLSNDIR